MFPVNSTHLKTAEGKNFNQESFGVGSVGSALVAGQKTGDNYLFRRQFYNPTQLPLEREEQEVDSVTVESRETEMVPGCWATGTLQVYSSVS